MVYDLADLAQTASSVTTIGVTLDSSKFSASDFVGITDGTKDCAEGDSIAGPFTISVHFTSAIQFSDVILYTTKDIGGNEISSGTVYAVDGAAETECGMIIWDDDTSE